MRNYEEINASKFQVVVDYNDIKNTPDGKAQVKLIKKPDYVNGVKIKPEKVEFLILN